MGEFRTHHFGDLAFGDFPGKEHLVGASPREILHRMLDHDDPLEIWGRSEALIESEAVLMAVDRLYLRALARVAHAAMRYKGTPPLEVWLAERVAFSLRELVQEDREADHGELHLDVEGEQRYAFLVAALGLEPQLARRACVRFNDEPLEVRRTFWRVVVLKQSIEEVAAADRTTPNEVRDEVARAFRAIGMAERPWFADTAGES